MVLIEFKSGISITWSLLLYVLTVQCSVGVAAVLDCSFNGLKSFLTDNSDLQVGRAQAVKCKLPSLESRKGPKHSPKHEFLNCKLSQFNWMYHNHLKHKHTKSTKQEMWNFASKISDLKPEDIVLAINKNKIDWRYSDWNK